MEKGEAENRLREILLNLKATSDLIPIIEELKLYEYFEPVKEVAERVSELMEKELSRFPQIKVIQKRVKTLDSIIFKMLGVETITGINRVNDVVGLRAIVERIKDCYELFHELLVAGFDPYFKIHDTLDKKNKYYRSLDANFLYKKDNCFQLQIRTPNIQRHYEDRGELSNNHYKKGVIKKVVKSSKKDELFGIDYKIDLLRKIADNFEKGYKIFINLESSERPTSLLRLLDLYSYEDLNYGRIEELRLSRRIKDVLVLHKKLIYEKDIYSPLTRLILRPTFRKIAEEDYKLNGNTNDLVSFSEAVNH